MRVEHGANLFKHIIGECNRHPLIGGVFPGEIVCTEVLWELQGYSSVVSQ